MVSDDDSTWEVQVSAFTEVLKQQILSNEIELKDINSEQTTQNQAITALQIVDTTQNTAMTNLQTSNTAQNTAIVALQSSSSGSSTAILALQNKTQNIASATSTATNMKKPLYITSPEAVRIYGDHGYISGWSTTTNNRDWYLGTDFAGTKRVVLQNDKQEVEVEVITQI